MGGCRCEGVRVCAGERAGGVRLCVYIHVRAFVCVNVHVYVRVHLQTATVSTIVPNRRQP